MYKERVVHAYNGILLSHKKNDILPCAATWHIILIQEKPEKKKAAKISLGLQGAWHTGVLVKVWALESPDPESGASRRLCVHIGTVRCPNFISYLFLFL